MSLQKAVDDKLTQIDKKIEWHQEQIKQLKENKKYWQCLLQDVEKLTKG